MEDGRAPSSGRSTIFLGHVLWTLDHLRRTPVHPSRPNLVFLHVLAPHPPFVFNADGSPLPTRLPAVLQDGSLWQQIARGSRESYRDAYTDAVRVLNARVVLALDELRRRQRRPAVFLIHSDHGAGSDLEWEDAEATDMRERLGILAAIRFPGRKRRPSPMTRRWSTCIGPS